MRIRVQDSGGIVTCPMITPKTTPTSPWMRTVTEVKTQTISWLRS